MSAKKRKGRKGKKQPRTEPVSRRQGGSRCRALIVIDSSRIRRKAFTNCKRARSTFEKAEEEMQHFETHDKPAFKRWYRMALGPKISETDRLTEEVRQWEQKLHRLDYFSRLKRCSIREAARLYEEQREEFERQEECLQKQLREEEELRQRAAEKRRAAMVEDVLDDLYEFLEPKRKKIKKSIKRGEPKELVFYELMNEFCWLSGAPLFHLVALTQEPEFADLWAEFGLDGALDGTVEGEFFGVDAESDTGWEAENSFAGETGRDKSSADPSDPETTRLNSLWREMAFALHPDQSDSGQDEAKLELWHQVQEAMQQRDVDRMEVLHAHMQILTGDLSPSTPVSRIQGLTEMYRHSREALRRSIRKLRQNDHRWGFAKLDERRRTQIRDELNKDMDVEIEELQDHLESLRIYYQQRMAPHRKRSTQPPPDKARRATREHADANGGPSPQADFGF